jgi:hypothetical protein
LGAIDLRLHIDAARPMGLTSPLLSAAARSCPSPQFRPTLMARVRLPALAEQTGSVPMTTRRAACNCGNLQIVCEGEPVRISMCHCLECQRRTGAVFGGQAWFSQHQTTISGTSTQFTRKSDAGRSVSFRFCLICGSTVYWEAEAFPGHTAVAVGSFADPAFPAPTLSGWERRCHHWLEPLRAIAIHHSD